MQTLPEHIERTTTAVPDYKIVRFCRDNLTDVARLHGQVYATAPPVEYFTRKYDTAYSGAEYIGYIAYNGEELPVAFYGVIPCFIQHENNIMLAAQSADTMTDPRHRYKGMFVELSNLTFELCRQSEIKLVFGFPNQNSYHGAVNRLGWQVAGTMAAFIIPVKSLPIEALVSRLRFLRGPYRSYRNFVLNRYALPLPLVPNSVLADGFAGVYRGEEYAVYKTYSPSKVIAIGGARIWISDKHGLLVGDIEGLTGNSVTKLIAGLKKIAKRLGVREVQFHCSEGTTLYQLFSKYYDPVPSYPVLFQDFGSGIDPANVRFTFADIDVF